MGQVKYSNHKRLSSPDHGVGYELQTVSYQCPTAEADGANADTERSDVLAPILPIRFIHVTNHMFQCYSEEARKNILPS